MAAKKAWGQIKVASFEAPKEGLVWGTQLSSHIAIFTPLGEKANALLTAPSLPRETLVPWP